MRCAHAMQTSWLQNTYCSTVDCMMLWGGTCGQNKADIMTVEHLLQHFRLHDAMSRDMWPEPTLLRDKLYGNLGELRRTAAFVRQQASPSSARRRRRICCLSTCFYNILASVPLPKEDWSVPHLHTGAWIFFQYQKHRRDICIIIYIANTREIANTNAVASFFFCCFVCLKASHNLSPGTGFDCQVCF